MAKKRKQAKNDKSGGMSWLTGILLLLVLGAGAGGAYYYFKPNQVTVPDLVGQTEQEARATLALLSLDLEVKEASPNEGKDPKAGQIVRHTPEAGVRVAKGTKIIVYVHGTPPGVDVPSVVGKTRSEAEDILRRAGFKVQFTEAQSEAVEIGKVISQNPAAASRLEKGQLVMLTVSGGKGQQAVPDLKELPVAMAREQLKKLGLELVVLEVAQPGFRSGDPVTVLRQEPQAGSKLSVGSRVTVFVPIPVPGDASQNGGYDSSLHAPRLEGLTVAQARQLAKEEKVELEFADSADETAVITFQEPPPGDPLPKGSASVLVRTASSSVVPGVTGMNLEQAKKRIKGAELTLGAVKKSYGPVEGEVLGQRPSAGIEVLSGSQVDLVVADPKMSPDSAKAPGPTPTPAYTPAPWVE